MPPAVDLAGAAPGVEATCRAAGLRVTLRGTLARYPGCVHWHFTRPGQSGTLELTLWPARRRLLFTVQARRAGAWMPAAIAELRPALERHLTSGAGTPPLPLA